jgi:TPR repeat protein
MNDEFKIILESCYDDYWYGDKQLALERLKLLSVQGSREASARLGEHYSDNINDDYDIEIGVSFYEIAIKQKCSQSAYNLFAKYFSGSYGLPKDIDQAKKYLAVAASMGNKLALDWKKNNA